MNADEIREWHKAFEQPGITAEVARARARIEIAAQLAELNQRMELLLITLGNDGATMSDPLHMHEYEPRRKDGLCKRYVGVGSCHLPEDAPAHVRWVEYQREHPTLTPVELTGEELDTLAELLENQSWLGNCYQAIHDKLRAAQKPK